MNTNDDRELKQWAADWQAAEPNAESAEQIRRYVTRRGRLVWSWMVIDVVIAAIALPVSSISQWYRRRRSNGSR